MVVMEMASCITETADRPRGFPMANPSAFSIGASSVALPVGAATVAIAVFAYDATTPVEVCAGVLYFAAVLMAARFSRRVVWFVAVGCVLLTICAHFLSPGEPWGSTALINRFIGILAIGLSTLIILRNQSVKTALQRAELERVTRLMTLGEMTASIAHEVKQPLTGIVTNAGACLRWLAHQPPKLEEAKQAIERLIRDSNRASEILQRIRDLVKGTPPRKESLNINETITEAIALAHSEMPRHESSLKTCLSADLPPVLGDRIQLQQVILNLLVNAIEAMKDVDGPREVLVSSKKHESTSVLIAVQDSGTGLDPDNFDRVFDAFHTTKADGMGMGLAICRSIIATHGGRLWATNNAPRGAIFQFTLPSR